MTVLYKIGVVEVYVRKASGLTESATKLAPN
jgi:hypothetical protein